jgi:hypothetical protein
MGGHMCKAVLMILAGLALIGGSMNYLTLDPWLVLGLLMLLIGLAPFVCKDDCCTKKK